MTWLGRIFRNRALDRQLDAELRDHVEREVAAAVGAGEDEAAARRRIRLQFGGLDQVKEACRDVRRPHLVRNVWTDVRFAARLLVRDRWFTAGAVGALALAIGLANVQFITLNALFLRGMPFPRPARIALVHSTNDRGFIVGTSYLDFGDWRQRTDLFESAGVYTQAPVSLSQDGALPEQVSGLIVSATTFMVLGVQPVAGRSFSPDDDRPGAEAVAIVSSHLWKGRYASASDIVGRRIVMNGDTPATIVGVMPDGFRFDQWVDVWMPLSQLSGQVRERRNQRSIWGVARLRDGVSFDRVRKDLSALTDVLARAYPDTNKNVALTVVPIGQAFIGGRWTDSMHLLPILAAGAILLVACANLASLLIARAASRFREVSIRVAIGATRWQIVRQLLIESLTISLVAAIAGLAISYAAVRETTRQFGSILGYWIRLDIDDRVLTFLLLTAVATTVLFGLAPALYATRHAVAGGLKEGGRAGESTKARRWSYALMVAQFGLTLALTTAAGLSARSYSTVYALDSRVHTTDVITASIRLPAQKYGTPDARLAFHAQLRARLSAAPAIAASAVASVPPFSPTGRRLVALLDGKPLADESPSVAAVVVSPEYLDTLGLAVVRGEKFSEEDGAPGHEVAVVNRRFVETYLADRSPIGRTLTLEATGPTAGRATVGVVGVAPDVRQSQGDAEPTVYLPFRATAPAAAALIVRGLGDGGHVRALRSAVHDVDPSLALGAVSTLDEIRDSSRLATWSGALNMSRFALVALLLAAVGLYSVVAYAVTRRTQEIGLRMALGAQPRHVRWLFLKMGVSVVAGGLAVGLPASFFVGRLLDINLIGVGAHDPATLIVTVVVIAIVALAACVIPARRATRLDPTHALRME